MKSRKDLLAATELAFDQAGSDFAPGSKPKGAAAPSEPPPSTARARTAPGSLLAAMGLKSDLEGELAALREKSKAWEDAFPARRVDTALIDESTFANRHEAHYDGPVWEMFRQEIANAGGNVQPVLLRPVEGARFQVVFGHRRVRACKDCGLPVLAVIQAVDDRELFELMDRENRQRADLTPYEQGESFRKALAAGLYPSRRQLASAIGRDLGWVGRYIAIAELPEAVLDAFPARTSIQKAWGALLADAVQRDPDRLLQRARSIASKPDRTASEVYAYLLGNEQESAEVRSVTGADGRSVATLKRTGRRKLEVSVNFDMPDGMMEKVAAALEKVVARVK